MGLLRITSRSGIRHVIRTRSQRRKRDDWHTSLRLHTHRQTRTASPVGELYGHSRYCTSHSRTPHRTSSASRHRHVETGRCWVSMKVHRDRSSTPSLPAPCLWTKYLPGEVWTGGTAQRLASMDRSSCPPGWGPSAIQSTARWMARGGRWSRSPRYLGKSLCSPTESHPSHPPPGRSIPLQSPPAHSDRSTGTSEGIHALALVMAPLGTAVLFPPCLVRGGLSRRSGWVHGRV